MQKDRPWLIALIVTGFVMIGLLSYNVWRRLPGLPPSSVPQGNVNQGSDRPSYDLGAAGKDLKIISPKPGDKLASPLVISGEARGWYFEGVFPVELKDANGASLARGFAQAQSDWMSADFVPFKAALSFAAPKTPTGTLVLRKDNPSGLPQNDAQVSFTVTFSADAQGKAAGDCRPGGCSGQVCTDQADIVTTCEWREEYACYKAATCARQPDGKCGWTPTPALKGCIDKANER